MKTARERTQKCEKQVESGHHEQLNRLRRQVGYSVHEYVVYMNQATELARV